MAKKFLRYISELIVIVLGISISLFFDEMAEDVKRDRQETYYLQSLLGNLEEDSMRLERAIQFIDQVNASSNALLQHCMEKPSVDMLSSELANSQTDLLQHTIFAANTSVFDELKSTGAFVAVKDKALKNVIFSYYGAIENTRRDDLSADDVITRFVYPRLNDNLPLARLVDIPEAQYSILFKSVEKGQAQRLDVPDRPKNIQDLVNAIAIRKGINMAQKANYRRLYEQNQKLIKMIRSEQDAS